MREKARKWLEEEKAGVVLAYKIVDGHSLPHVFRRDHIEELDELVIGPARYPLEKMAAKLAQAHPEVKIAILARDCTQRALTVLTVWNQVPAGQIQTLSANCCPSRLKDHPDCSYLEPEKSGFYKRQAGIDNSMEIEDFEAFSRKERLDRWIYEFQKCIKCYGCRNICPVCFCKECSLEHKELIDTGAVPPEVPIFHLVRAVHMAGRCVDCGLCEDACPVDIPLRLLYRKVNQIVMDTFDYKTGGRADQPPFSMLGDEVKLQLRPIDLAA